MASVGNFDFRARRRQHKGQPRPMGGYDYESSSFPTSPAAPQDYDGGHFSWPPPGLSPYSSGYSYDHDRYERDRYEHDRYEHDRYERERYAQERYERDRYEHDRYDYDHRYEHHRYEQHGRSGHGSRFGHEERWHGGERYEHEHNYNHKLPDFIDPRIPSTHPDSDYLAYLDSLYTPLEGMPQAPVMHSDFDDWRDWRADDWSANPGLFDTLDDAHDVLPSPAEVSKEDHSRPKYFGDAPGSSCSTSDTDGQVLKLPTKGSAKHNLGTCKPCAFVYKNGCASGYDCEFCHLCKPGEKKRRKKERKQQMRHIR